MSELVRITALPSHFFGEERPGQDRYMQEDCPECYGEDGAKEIILAWLDELGICPDDIDTIFARLDFCNYRPA